MRDLYVHMAHQTTLRQVWGENLRWDPEPKNLFTLRGALLYGEQRRLDALCAVADRWLTAADDSLSALLLPPASLFSAHHPLCRYALQAESNIAYLQRFDLEKKIAEVRECLPCGQLRSRRRPTPPRDGSTFTRPPKPYHRSLQRHSKSVPLIPSPSSPTTSSKLRRWQPPRTRSSQRSGPLMSRR